MFLQCVDDPAFVHDYRGATKTCADMNDYRCEHYTDDNTGAPASEACPASCLTGCALTFDSCWNQQETCQNGGVCVNLPGVEAFGCDGCSQGYWGARCQWALTSAPPVPTVSSIKRTVH